MKPIFASFDKGQVPNIACVNHATVDLGVPFDSLVAVMQRFLDSAFVPVWGTPAKLYVSVGFEPKSWAMLFLDDADADGALGYHDLTPDGLPLSKVFVKPTLAAGEKIGVTATHELAEMLVDPAINLCAVAPNGTIYAYETADAVEQTSFKLNDIDVTNFIYPAWFEGFRKARSTQFDYLKKVTRPYRMLPGGYSIVFKNGKWTEIFGSEAKAKRFVKEDRRGHRSEHRKEKMFKPAIGCFGTSSK